MIILRRPRGRFACVGHRGASALAPENTIRALELAVELGCDMLEFDVLPLRDGTLVLSHSQVRHRTPDLATLDEALAFCADRLPETGLQVDLKLRGIEERVVDALHRHQVLERSWVSSFDPDSLRRVAELEPELPRSYTYPRNRFGVAKRVWVARRVPALLRRARADALTLHHSVTSREAIARAHELGAAVYVWTVNDADVARRLVEAEADGIITDDPRIFGSLKT